MGVTLGRGLFASNDTRLGAASDRECARPHDQVTLLDFRFGFMVPLEELQRSGIAQSLVRADGVVGALPGQQCRLIPKWRQVKAALRPSCRLHPLKPPNRIAAQLAHRIRRDATSLSLDTLAA